MRLIPGAAAIVSVAACAQAALLNPEITWEVSTDGGMHWASSAVLLTYQPAVIIRGTASWERPADSQSALASVRFDGFVHGSLGETGGNIVRPLQQSLGAVPGSVVNLGQGNMRFSRNDDTGQAGINSNWWTVGQDANVDLNFDGLGDFPDQNTADPVPFLSFDLNIDFSAAHTMVVSSVLTPVTGSAGAFRVYNNASLETGGSTTNFLDTAVTQHEAQIIILPAPTSAASLALAAVITLRRKRAVNP